MVTQGTARRTLKILQIINNKQIRNLAGKRTSHFIKISVRKCAVRTHNSSFTTDDREGSGRMSFIPECSEGAGSFFVTRIMCPPRSLVTLSYLDTDTRSLPRINNDHTPGLSLIFYWTFVYAELEYS